MADIIVTLSEARTLDVFQTLIGLFEKSNISWFCKEALPQINFRPKSIEKNSYEHRCWLFFMAMLTVANNSSDDIFYRSLKMYERNKGLFLPKIVARHINIDNVRAFLEQVFGRYNLEMLTRAWKDNATMLGRDYQWEPLMIFKGVDKHKEARERIRQFSNFGDKIASLLIEWFEEIETIPRFYGPPPIDFHVLRLLIITECILVKGLDYNTRVRADKIIRRVIPLLEPFCYEHQFPTALDPVMWLWGRNVCSKWPLDGRPHSRQPRTSKSSRCHWCPVEKYCKHYFSYGSYRSKEGISLEPRQDLQLYLFDKQGRPIF